MLAIRGIILIFFLLIAWQVFVTVLQLPPYIFPSPWMVLESSVKNGPSLLTNAIPTIIETISGLLLGIFVGMIVALLMINIKWVRYWLLPIIIVSQAIPTFAVAPLLVLWFGYGLFSKIITITFMLFFPVASAFYDGMARTNPEWLDMASIMNGSKLNVLWHLRFPAAMPSLASGIHVATVLAPIGAIISEWVGSSSGLGFLMLNANARLETALMFACIIFIMTISLLLYFAVDKCLKRFISW